MTAKLVAILACHNRRELTMKCVESAQHSAHAAGVRLDFVVYDDGSTDGTGDALTAAVPSVAIITGDGDAFWASSMSVAESYALQHFADSEYLLWLNDDVVLDVDAIPRLVDESLRNPRAIIVGSVRDPITAKTTYGGLNRKGLHPLSFALVEPGRSSLPADTFNGNILLVPVDVAQTIGGIDGGYAHGFADVDYGLRANRQGFPALVAPGTYGTCPRNVVRPRGQVIEDWAHHLSRKGPGHFASLRRILSKGHPRIWPIPLLGSYTLWWIRRARGVLPKALADRSKK